MAKNGKSTPPLSFRSVTAMNQKQKQYIEAINRYDNIISVGPPGTSKTYIPCSLAAEFLHKQTIGHVVVIRPNTSCGKSLGFLPGDYNEKFMPWCAPILEIFEYYLGEDVVQSHVYNNVIQLQALEYMRGCSLHNSFIILDEAQNVTVDQIKMVLTRIGYNSKCVITGDLSQSDLRTENGLSFVLERLNKFNDNRVPIIQFTAEDIIRSESCKFWFELLGG